MNKICKIYRISFGTETIRMAATNKKIIKEFLEGMGMKDFSIVRIK